MKMKNILVGFFLGLFALVQTTPVTTVTQIPAKAEDDVFREAVTDGFLVNHLFTTQSPKRNATIHASQRPSSDPTEAVTEAPSEETTTTTALFEDWGDHDTTTRDLSSSSPSHFTSSSLPDDDKPSTTSATQTTEPVSSFDLFSTLGSGSGDGEETEQDATKSFYTTSASNTEITTTALMSTTTFIHLPVLEDVEGSGSELMEETTPSTSTALPIQSKAPRMGSKPEPEPEQEPSPTSGTTEKAKEEERSITKTGRLLPMFEPVVPPSKQAAANSTPGWVIIVGFIVGVAALVMLCVAIATRDKWNGPPQGSQAKADSSNQQGAQEMETFLHKEEPRENGKSAEYTVIPLEDLPESHSSH